MMELTRQMMERYDGLELDHVRFAIAKVQAGATTQKAMEMTYAQFSRGVKC